MCSLFYNNNNSQRKALCLTALADASWNHYKEAYVMQSWWLRTQTQSKTNPWCTSAVSEQHVAPGIKLIMKIFLIAKWTR